MALRRLLVAVACSAAAFAVFTPTAGADASHVEIVKPTFSASEFVGPSIAVNRLPQVAVKVTGPKITHPGDPVLPPNPIRPVVEITSLLHD